VPLRSKAGRHAQWLQQDFRSTAPFIGSSREKAIFSLMASGFVRRADDFLSFGSLL